jgi:hypothetical protein
MCSPGRAGWRSVPERRIHGEALSRVDINYFI